MEPRKLPLWHLVLVFDYEHDFDGELPDDDVVANQGRFLVTRPNTPIEILYGTKPAEPVSLQEAARHVEFLYNLRRQKYGDEVAEEYAHRHTPSPIQDAWWETQAAAVARMDDSTDDEDSIHHGKQPESPHRHQRASSQPARTSGLLDEHEAHKISGRFGCSSTKQCTLSDSPMKPSPTSSRPRKRAHSTGHESSYNSNKRICNQGVETIVIDPDPYAGKNMDPFGWGEDSGLQRYLAKKARQRRRVATERLFGIVQRS